VLNEALEFLGLTGDAIRQERPQTGLFMSRREHRELAETMRTLPGRFTDRMMAGSHQTAA
jgi:hypothetical protein